MDNIRILRLLVYTGPRDLVEAQVAKSIQGTREFYPSHVMKPITIQAITLDSFPEVLEVPITQPGAFNSWNGGEEPPHQSSCDILYRNGTVRQNITPNEHSWLHFDAPYDIVGWRLPMPQFSEREKQAIQNEGWIASNGYQPADLHGKAFEVKLRNGKIVSGQGRTFCWEQAGIEHDIIAYRTEGPDFIPF